MYRFTTNPPCRQVAPRPIAETNHGLLKQIGQFCHDKNISVSAFGRRALNDSAFVSRLHDTAFRPTAPTIRKVLGYIRGEAAHA